MKLPKLHFERFEFKYILSSEQYSQIKRHIFPYMEADENSGGGFYEVVSLYYDSPKFFHYWEKIDGVRSRKKIRVRTYRKDGAFSDNVFFEIKRKNDSVVMKDRLFLSRDDYSIFQKDNRFYALNNGENENRQKVIDEYHYDKGLRFLEPKVLVVYNREPLLGRYNKNVRVTFDFSIKTKLTDDLYYRHENMTDVSGNKVIMEVKFRGTLPYYLREVITQYNLNRVPYSKYCESLESCYSLPLLQLLGNHSQSDSLRLNRNSLLTE